MSTDLHDVELIVVSYRSRNQLEVLLPSLPGDVRLALVDNSPGQEEIADLIAGHDRWRLVPEGPGGFAAAVNLAVASSDADYVVLINPDSRPTRSDLAAIVASLREEANVAAAAALTVSPDGRPEIGAGGWRPTPRRALVHALGLHTRLPHAGMVARPVRDEPITLDWVCGAVLAMPRATFLRLGGFDERYYMYGEDMDYGIVAQGAGLRSVLRTDVAVPHEGGGSGAPRTHTAWLRGRAQGSWLRDELGRVSADLIRSFLALGAIARVPLYLLRGKRNQARESLSFAKGLWDGNGTGLPRTTVNQG